MTYAIMSQLLLGILCLGVMVQTVRREDHPRFYAILEAFRGRTGCGALINTSFNVRGEPIVCTAREAYVCFMRTGIDVLVVDGWVFEQADQPPLVGAEAQGGGFEAD